MLKNGERTRPRVRLAAPGREAVSRLLVRDAQAQGAEPIIDIRQQVNYGRKRGKQWRQIGPARTDQELAAHPTPPFPQQSRLGQVAR